MARLSTANDILNRAAVELGLPKSNNPVGSQDETFVQLTELLDACGQEMVELHPWQVLVKEFQVTTTDQDTGTYSLPDDFSYMIDQTGWERSQSVPIGGPLSAQDWTFLVGNDSVSQTIYASFRLVNNEFEIYPQPPPTDLDINFEYISRNWAARSGDMTTRFDYVDSGSNIILYEPILIIKFLKTKFLSAKGLDASAAALDFDTMFQSRIGKDVGASILSASRSAAFPYISPYRNTGDTNFGG